MCEEVKMKKCTKCKREFPAIADYFHKDKYNEDGLTFQCKECRSGKKIFGVVKTQPKNGYKFCIKCSRELPIDIKYFPKDKNCKTGFRHVCRECGQDGHFMEDGYIPKEWWTEDENQLLIERYPHYTSLELIELFYPNETMKSLADKAYKLGCNGKTEEAQSRANTHKSLAISQKLKGHIKSEETRRKLSNIRKMQYITGEFVSPWKGRIVTQDERDKLSQRVKGKWSGDKNPRVTDPLSGERNGRWEGGIKDLYFDLRDKILEWKEASMLACNYRCVLTGKYFDNIHHLTPFRQIVNEVFEELNMPMYKTIGQYTEHERKLIIQKLCEIHKKYGLGVCLTKQVHKLFHDTYGYLNNTPHQFEEFKQSYFNGEFNGILQEAN